MLIEEDVSVSIQKINQISHLGTKLSKFQLQQMNLDKIIHQCMKFVEEGIPFRDCTNYLHGLALVYLKQYQILKQEIAALQNSMMNKENFVEEEKKKPRSKSKQPKPKKSMPEAIAELQENSNSSRDNPRNIASEERLQLDSQRNPFDMSLYLKRGDSDDSNSYGQVANIINDVKLVEKQSLKEIIKNRKNIKENSKASSESSKNTPNLPRIVVNEVQEIMEEQPQLDYNDGPEQMDADSSADEEKVNNSVEIKHAKILSALEEFGVLIQNQQLNSQEKEKQKPQKRAKKKNAFPIKDEIIDEVVHQSYRSNLDEFIKYQEKYDQLRQKMDALQLQPEFWCEKDELFNLIQGMEVNQTVINIKNKKPQLSNSKMQGQTTIEQSGNIIQESTNYHDDYDISEFPQNDLLNSGIKMDQPQIKIYEKLLSDLQNKFSKENVLDSIQYFNFRQAESSKAKAFQDLLFMSRLGFCKLNKTQVEGQYSKFAIEF